MIPTFIGHFPGSPCAACGRIELPGGTTAPPNTRPLCGEHFAAWERSTITNEAPGAVFKEIRQATTSLPAWNVPSSSPIDDLREAVRPRPLRPKALVVGPAQAVNIRRALGGEINHARDDDDRADFDRRYPVHPAQGVVNEIAAKVAPGHEPPTVAWTKPDDGPVVFRTYGFAVRRPPWPRTLDPNKSYPIDSLEGRQAIGANPPASVDLTEPHVATLPDGHAVDLPAGTVLREGEDDAAKQRRSYEFAALEAAAKYVTCGVMGTASEHEDSETQELRRAVGDLLAFIGEAPEGSR